MDYEPALACRCCGGTDLRPVLSLGRQPLANSYLKEPAALPSYPLELQVCAVCFHSQLSVVVRPDLMFRHYLYVSGTSRTLRAHFAGFARESLSWVEARPARVLDLACNDGTLLEAFRREGCLVSGVDPAKNLVRLARGKGLEVVEGYWPQARAEVQGKFDLITAANVLAHMADPCAFLKAALECLTDQGIMVLEFPYCREMILRSEWDTIYHEHLSYFLVSPLLKLLSRVHATVSQVRLVPVHGGSLRLAVCPGDQARHCPEALALAKAERQDGLLGWPGYKAFARRADETCKRLAGLVGSLVAEGQKVIAYGASAKGNTLLNRCPLPLAYIVDDNPLKHGCLTPGRNIPIRSPAVVLEEGPGLCVLLLAWNFAREIVGNLRAWRPGKGDRVIHHVPEVCCRGVDADLALLE
jgi:hypothetical protein